MTHSLVLRIANQDDAESIGRFQTRAWEQSYRGIVPDEYLDATTWRDRAHRWRRRMESGEREVWVAEIDGSIEGVASTALTGEKRFDLPARELSSLYVDAAWQGKGVATALLDRAIGHDASHLWVFDANVRAQRFYAKRGFVATRERQTDIGTGLAETRWVRDVLVTREAE